MSLGAAPRPIAPRVSNARSAARRDVCWVSVAGCSDDQGVDSYRVRLPMRYVEGRYVDLNPVSLATDDLLGADVTIWMFSGDQGYLEAQRRAQAAGSLVLIEADDNLLCEDMPLDSWCVGPTPWNPSLIDRERIATLQDAYRESLAGADGLIVSTPALADAIGSTGLVDHIWICPNAIDPADWPEHLPRREGPFTVGFAGHVSHLDDLELILDAMAWAAGQPDMEAAFIGFDPSEDDRMSWAERLEADTIIRRLRSSGRLRRRYVWKDWERWQERVRARRASWDFAYGHAGWTNDLDAYHRSLVGLDVGLCPVIPNDFSNCRGDAKLMEYAMAGALPIVSDAQPYEGWENTPVLFARDNGEFLEHVRWAACHRNEVRERAAAVREIVLRDRAMPDAVAPWRAAVEEALT